ncbi:MAG: protein kinase [Kiritimatiellia bacterium]
MDQLSLPGFELLDKIGQGGMATVWKARQLSLDRLVAIKVLSPRLASEPADVERFHAECRSAAMLKHPGIVQVYDALMHKGLYCLIMEYVAGESLGNRIRRKKKMSEDEVLFVLEHVGQALGHAWKSAGLIHCDIKPDNILIDADGSVKVTDLGLATTLGGMNALAQTDEVMGTPQYMSPEQIIGTPALDTRTDIFSMGATVYQMLTGKMLFEGTADDAVLDLMLKGQVPDVLDLTPSLSSRIAWMTEKMLARNREHRHADWSAVTADVARLMRRGYPAPPFPAPVGSVMQRSNRRLKPHQPAPPPTTTLDKAPGSSSDTVLRTLLVIGILAALAVAAYFIFRPRAAPHTPLRPPPAVHRAPAPTPNPAVDSAEKRYAEMFEFAKNWWQSNPERYQEAIDQFDRVAKATRDSKYSLMALDAMRSVREARQAALQGVMQPLRDGAAKLGQARQFDDAAALFEDYSGKLAAETGRERRIEAQRWRKKAAQAHQSRQAQGNEARLAFEGLLDEAVASLLQNRLEEAAQTLAAAESRPEMQSLLAELKTVADLVKKAGAMDQKIADSFTRQAGQEVTVQLLSGPKTIVLDAVRNGAVFGDQKVSVGEGVAVALIKIRFSFDELAPRERLQRMGPDTDPDVALFKGCAALHNRGAADARLFFSALPEPLGPRLLAGLERREAEAAAARPAAPTVAPPPSAEPAKAAPADGIRPSADAFAALLVEANPGLKLFNIKCETDSRGNIVRFECKSPHLQNLEPLNKLAASLECLSIPDNQAANLAPLAGLSRLRRLNLAGSSVADLAAIKDLRLESLNLNNTRVKDLSPLRGMPLLELEIAATRVSIFDPLRNFSLTRVNLANTPFSELSFIRDMPLRDMNISGTKVFDFLSLRRFPQLAVFQAADTGFKDPSLLAEMPLVELNLANTKLNDLTALRRMPLQNLNISGTPVKDLSPLQGHKIEQLRFNNCRIKDLTPLAGLPLKVIAFSGTLIEDLTPLRGLSLTEFVAANTGIGDLSPLEGMPLSRVILSNTKVTSLKPLASAPLTELRCEGLNPECLAVLRSPDLEILYCDLRPGQMGQMGLFQAFPRLKELNGYELFRRMQN